MSSKAEACLDLDAGAAIEFLAGFVRLEIRRTGCAAAVLGLSGGVDSALVAAIAAKGLGPENVHGLFMPYRGSDPQSRLDAQAVAQSLGIQYQERDITPQVDAYFERGENAGANRLRRGNKMARERMAVLYDASQQYGALVLGTSNKTELLLGYGTLFGDMASAINPLGDLYKTQVWQLARAAGLPAAVVDKAPSADLWAGQSDEQELGFSYSRVDALLARMIDARMDDAGLLAAGHKAAFIKDIRRRISRSQFKRLTPVIAKLSPRTLGREFRYPRDWGSAGA
jgi:NAD+ synthase